MPEDAKENVKQRAVKRIIGLERTLVKSSGECYLVLIKYKGWLKQKKNDISLFFLRSFYTNKLNSKASKPFQVVSAVKNAPGPLPVCIKRKIYMRVFIPFRAIIILCLYLT